MTENNKLVQCGSTNGPKCIDEKHAKHMKKNCSKRDSPEQQKTIDFHKRFTTQVIKNTNQQIIHKSPEHCTKKEEANMCPKIRQES